MLYLSGMIGMESSMKLSPGGITAETRQATENIKATLRRNGFPLDHAIKVDEPYFIICAQNLHDYFFT